MIPVIPGATWRANDSEKAAKAHLGYLAPPSVGFTLSRLSQLCSAEAMICQFVHFFVIWILSF